MSPEPTASKDNLTTPASPTISAATGQGERQSMTIRYVDRADMAETFADSITGLVFDGQTLRIEFGVTRLDDVKANAQRTARRYPACRLVLSPATAVELINRMQQIGAALTQAGVVKATPRAGGDAAKAG
jgi:alpha-D-ribose 1-methylphosphonate 5-triphosphate synthase subunit PhnI